LGSIGRALPDVEVGEIAIRSDRLMRGYYGESDNSDRPLRDGWLHTRDLGWMDADGYVFLTGRSTDLIIRGGENIAPAEIEQVLKSHPDVEEAAVVGIPDDEWGELVAAAVVRRPGARVTLDALVEYTRQRLASFKKPERIMFVDAVPTNPMGKVLRKQLKSLFNTP
jgi:acyl-CoA synthetase (AMP-forming)/AMP-acid ligase II